MSIKVDLVCRCDLRSGIVWLVGVASIGTCRVANALGGYWCCHRCCFLGAAGAAWHLAAGGTTGLNSRCFPLFVSWWDVSCSEQLEFGCISAHCFPITGSSGMDCRANYLCGNVYV